uniref:Uncharacterized protein n=1 Tax=Romanomermis culicivorax TaxID=13658 RepID=A0A915JEI8_ROMCU
MNNERICSSANLRQNDRQPFYANMNDISTLEDDRYANFVINNNRSILSKNNSFLDLSMPKNLIEKPCFATDRFKQRLAACQLGLRQLELLRNKHKHMIWQVKTQVMAPLMEGATETKNSAHKCHDSSSITSSTIHHQTQRCHSPAPSSGDSSNFSYRSSMSTDSGWMSMGATDHARHSSSDSNSTIQKNDNSLIVEEENHDINHHTYENIDFSGHPVLSYKAYCGVDLIDKLNKRLSKSYVSIENGNMDREQEAPPPPKPPFRYRRRGLQPPTDHHRPKSLYIYPNNQDAHNNYANSGYAKLMDNLYENSGASKADNNNNRRLSIAQASDYRDHVTRTEQTPVFTWDEVKMMLENDFASNAATPSCPKHRCCARPLIPATVARLQAACRPLVSRSMSVQSVEGSSKYKRCREKLWRESDCL